MLDYHISHLEICVNPKDIGYQIFTAPQNSSPIAVGPTAWAHPTLFCCSSIVSDDDHNFFDDDDDVMFG